MVGTVHTAGKREVYAAVAAARAALQGPWGKLSVESRVKMLDAVAEEINNRFDDFLAAEIADTGKPVHLASHVGIPRGAANFRNFADTIKNSSTESFNMMTHDGRTALSYGLRVPRGVIAVIFPWNLPLLLMTWKVGPALACGNTVVVKPAEETPSTVALLGEVMNKVGVPPSVYKVVHGFGPDSAGVFLTSHPGVNGITFTGETRTGTAIMKAGADGIRPVSLELSGKNAARKEQMKKVLSYYQKARDEGATVVTGGCVPDMPAGLKDGYWVQPTIWTGLPSPRRLLRCVRKSSARAATPSRSTARTRPCV
jgi:aminomuconate-semialdehyde/2-hydroxymuconate-6-semialdehyde dehydrogenase